MSYFLFKTLLFGRSSARANSLRWFSITNSERKRSFVVSYLIDSLGFSPKAALSASKQVKFDSPEKPDKAVEFLKGYGFTHSQISSLVRSRPIVLVCDAEKIIFPKLEFLRNKGILVPDLAKRLSVYPALLTRSLDKQIIPAYEFFRNLFRSDEKTIKAVLRNPDILAFDIKTRVEPNIAILREHGVPHSNIAAFILRNPRIIVYSPEMIRRTVEEVAEMGFDAAQVKFVVAVIVIREVSKTKWESKVNVYKEWGWSEELVLKAFQKQPTFRTISEDKISACMDFFTNQTCWTPFDIVKLPLVLKMSLEKRLIPRYLVYQHLLSNGLLKKEVGLYSLFGISDEKFLRKFVTCYENEAPELLKLYEQKSPYFQPTREQSSSTSML